MNKEQATLTGGHADEIARLQAEKMRLVDKALGFEQRREDQARNDRRALVLHMLSFARTYSALELDVLHEATQKDLEVVDSLAVRP